MTCNFRFELLFFGASMLLCILGCNRSSASFGNVVRFEIVDVGGSVTDSTDSSLISGNATTENQDFLNDLRDLALKAFSDGKWVNYGPDSSFRTIRLVCEHGEIELNTWHPGAEENPGVVASSHGLTALNGQSRDEFLRNDDRAYVAKREKYDDIERRLLSRFKGS